jgi:hypothetical protein
MSDNRCTVLTEAQERQICQSLQQGCDLETAAGKATCALADIVTAIAANPQFALRVRFAEATAEETHMKNVLDATKDGKYWRASVWWLEQRSPERFGHRAPGVVTPRQLERALETWRDRLLQEFNSPDDQKRVMVCLDEIATSIDLLLDAQGAASRLLREIQTRPRDCLHENNAGAVVPRDALPTTNSPEPS